MSSAKALLPSTKAWESLDGIFGDLTRGRLDFATLADGPLQADNRMASARIVENSLLGLEVFMGSPCVSHSIDDPQEIMFHLYIFGFPAKIYALLVATSTSGFGSRTRVSSSSNPASFSHFSISSG